MYSSCAPCRLPQWLSSKESACNVGDMGLLPGEFHGQRSLAVYSPWGRKESDTT